MANVSVNRLTNGNVYVDGANCLGMVEEVKVPRPKAKMTDHKGLGMVGTLETPSGIDKLEAELKWVSIYDVPELLIATPFSTRQYQVRGNLQSYGPTGLIVERPVIWLFTAALKDMGDALLKQHENVDLKTVLSVYHCEQYLGGVQTFLYDVFANIFVVNGIDQLAQYRANLGA